MTLPPSTQSYKWPDWFRLEPKNDRKPKPGGRYMLFVLYKIFVFQKLAKNCRRQKFYDYLTFTIRNFILFALRNSLLGLICYPLFGIPYSDYTNRNIRLLHQFLKIISSSINHLLTIFLSVLTQYFIFDQYEKLRKSKYRCVFISMYVYIILDRKFIDLFGKIVCANNMSYIKNLT